MALIYINTRFPKTKKAYTKAGDENTAKLMQIMEKLTIASKEEEVSPPAVSTPQQRGASPWAYTDKKRGKSKTFKL